MKSPESSRVYFDHNATTPVLRSIIENSSEWLTQWGNPSSIHWSGRGPKKIIREARKKIAQKLNCSPLELIFTSGGSESNNTVIKGVYESFEQKMRWSPGDEHRNEYITTGVEHPSVRKVFEYLKSKGKTVHFIPVDREGVVDLQNYQQVLSPRTALVSVMYANNETGHVFPVKEMARMAREAGALFHTDGVQALGKTRIDLKEWDVDFASFSGHKFYSLKGCGLIYSKTGNILHGLIQGGGQERGRRAGTENTLAIAALGDAIDHLNDEPLYSAQVQELRNSIESQVLERISGVKIIGQGTNRIGNTSNLIIAGVDGETLLMNLDLQGFSVSTGAACSSGNPEPSPVLLAMGFKREEAQSSLRISLGWQNTQGEVNEFVEKLEKVVNKLRSLKDSNG
ncbi:MAG: cysteine desulfurase [Bdellovibrionales bacterium]|nr:cysteine desulfurase [Bdellovibrionales bacterium]